MTPPSDLPAAAAPALSRLGPQVGNRLTILLFGFCLWAALIVLRLGQFMIVERDRTVEAMHREATFVGVVPAARGRILDRTGRILAWSERVFVVHWNVPRYANRAAQELARLDAEPWLTGRLPHPLPAAMLGTRVELATDVDLDHAVRLDGLGDQVHGLEVSATFRRRVVPDPAVRAFVGTVGRSSDGTEVGLSGAEREHDDVLRGVPGAFHVMLDKEGRWLPETWQKTAELRPGFDVQLPVRTAPTEGAPP